MSIAGADAAIARFMERTAALVTLSDSEGRTTARALLTMLTEADRDLGRRLRRWTRANNGAEGDFTGASLVAFRTQVQAAIAVVRRRLEGITNETALGAADTSFRRTGRLLLELDRQFTGSVRPFRLDEAIVIGLRGSLRQRHADDATRYGQSIARAVEQTLTTGLLTGRTQGEMVTALMKVTPDPLSLRSVEVSPELTVRVSEDEVPQGVFLAHRAWAWRIVRTETAEAQNAVSQASIERATETFPDMGRKILAILDIRTSPDSLGVHGQTRAIDKPFRDGAGRVYMRPPSRPNDRETLIPWRRRWPNTPRSRPLTARERTRIEERNARAQAARRKLS